ncbi:MAG: hypothetical protein KDK27_06640 [Leptospiraceae bacterium]|nr:hypothetical protein [Leptospiraceae bacterium]
MTDIFKGCLRLPILFPLAIIILMGTGANPFIVESGSTNPSALYAEQNQESVTDQNGDVSPGAMDDADRDTSPPETEFYFGDSNGFNENDTHLFNNAFDGEGSDSSGIAEENNDDNKWLNDDEVTPLFPEIRILDEISSEHSLKRLEDARRYYREAMNALQLGAEKAAAAREGFNVDNTRYDWERREKMDALNRQIKNIEATHRQEAINYLIKSIQLMDQVKNPSVIESGVYLDLKSSIYRQYVKQQFRNHNLHLCIDILERYMRIRPEHSEDPEAHRLLAACYRFQEVIADRMNDRNARNEFKRAKNEHILKYAALAFGPESTEFQMLHRNVQRDMVEVIPDNGDRH